MARNSQAWIVYLDSGPRTPGTEFSNWVDNATWNPLPTPTDTMQIGDICTFIPYSYKPWENHPPEQIYSLKLGASLEKHYQVNPNNNVDYTLSDFQTKKQDLQSFLERFTLDQSPSDDDFFTHACPIYLNLKFLNPSITIPKGESDIRIMGWSAKYNPGKNKKGKKFYISFAYGDPTTGKTRVEYV